MDLFGPSRTMSLGGNYYGLVIVDDYSRFTWTFFIATKDETYHAFKRFVKVIQNKKDCSILPLNRIVEENFRIRSLTDFAINWVLNTTSQHQELHSR